jgi:hypothetical protein
MAHQTTVTYLDDIDGGKAVETVSFALDGAHYAIDLSAKNAKALRKALAEFVEHGRHIKPSTSATGRAQTKGPGRGSRSRPGGHEMAAVRAWAAERGIEVAPRGRIASNVKAQYEAATGQ